MVRVTSTQRMSSHSFPIVICLGTFVLSLITLMTLWAFSDKVLSLRTKTELDEETLYPWNVDCSEDQIYQSNELYDCNGLLKGPNDGNFEEILSVYLDLDALSTLPVPQKLSQELPRLRDVDTETKDPNFIFLNCGGTFPWPVEKFRETMPEAEKFQIFSIISDLSYEVFYRTIPNHTLLHFECSTQQDLVNIVRQDFGSGFELESTEVKISLADWLRENTNKTDYVVLRMESETEQEILEDLIQTEAIAYVDKYYTSSDLSRDLVNQTISDHVKEFGYWSYDDLMYSDTKALNPLQIPLPGRTLTACGSFDDEHLFALFLISKDYNAHAEHALRVLAKFSSRYELPVTFFLPYTFFKFSDMTTDDLKTFRIGLYIDGEVIAGPNTLKDNETIENERGSYLNILSAIICAQKRLKRHNKIMEYVLIDNDVDKSSISAIQLEYNIDILYRGIDISSLITKVVTGDTPVLDDTGRTSKEYLMINMDVERAEYLAVNMIRRFRPWLLDIINCDQIHL